MIKVNLLRGILVANGFTQAEIAKELNISTKTFSNKLKSGVFGSDEIEKMIDVLKIEDPISIFFAKEVS